MSRPGPAPAPAPQPGWPAARPWSPASRPCSPAPCSTPPTRCWPRSAAPGECGAAHRAAARADAARDLLVARHLPRQRRACGQHQRMEPVGRPPRPRLSARGRGCARSRTCPLAEWTAAWARTFHAHHGRLASRAPARGPRPRCGLLPRLAVHYSDAPWWKHDVWCLRFDPRIPRRDHEPHGDASVRWDDIAAAAGCAKAPSSIPACRWNPGGSPGPRFAGARVRRPLREFALSRGISHPALADDPSQLRAVALDFRVFLQQWRRDRPAHGHARGGPLNARSVARTLRFLGNFYATMNDYRADAAAATGDDGWLALTDSHARLYRGDELSANGPSGRPTNATTSATPT